MADDYLHRKVQRLESLLEGMQKQLDDVHFQIVQGGGHNGVVDGIMQRHYGRRETCALCKGHE